MNKKVILAITACILIVGASVFVIIDLVDSHNAVKEVQANELQKEKLVETTEVVEETTDIFEETTEETTTEVNFGGPQVAGVIQVPTICGPKERLDPKTNKCKRII